jgi:protease-4
MDYQQNENQPESIGPQPSEPMISPLSQTAPVQPAKKGTGWRIFWGIVLAFSILANIMLFLMLIASVAFFAVGQRGIYGEELIQAGPRTNKIAVVPLRGLINGTKAQDIYKQLELARKDRFIKGIIIRVNSPGGTISGCDQIYNEIRKFRATTNMPVIAFMQGMAASGGYYTSVACEKIVAEPTTITGSIGVIMGYFVLQDLLEGKLGIQPIIIKSGEKKDWPSSFRQPTEEELQYLHKRMLEPAYKRFVEIVDEGRELLSLDEAKELADGSIYSAKEALEKKMIDDIGYLDDAIEQVKALAGIERARVVEYRKPFSMTDFLITGSRNFLKIDRTTLYELSIPQVLYLWSGY